MNDLISRKSAIRLAEQGQIQGFEWQFKKLCELPPAQPQIIRCDNCKNYHKDECPMRHVEWIIDGYDSSNEVINDYAIDDGFCYMGDRRENE